jgi:CubicO group peptidase (beta-lactamase class C family)
MRAPAHRTALASVAFATLLGSTAAATPRAGNAASTVTQTAPGHRNYDFPGSGPWRQVPARQLAEACDLDPKALAKSAPSLSITAAAIFRHGKLCWSGGSKQNLTVPYNVNSATKTFTALLFGLVATRTGIDENTLYRSWLTALDSQYQTQPVALAIWAPPPNPNALIFNALTSTGHYPDMTYGYRGAWAYETLGEHGMNSLTFLINKIVRAYPDKFPGSTSAKELAENEIFKPLGMTHSSWDGVTAAGGLMSNVYDMGKLGELMLRKGRWGDKQLIDEDYIYRMTHPEIEDVHTGYGYLTWLNSAAGVAKPYDYKVDPYCSPFVSWRKYPHAPTYEAPNSNGGNPFNSKYDVGVFWADGAGGQFIVVHRALDLVMVIKDDEAAQKSDPEAQKRGAAANPVGIEYHRLWRLVRPAVIAADKKYKGNEAAFCKAYQTGNYAPDLRSPWGPDSGFGRVG